MGSPQQISQQGPRQSSQKGRQKYFSECKFESPHQECSSKHPHYKIDHCHISYWLELETGVPEEFQHISAYIKIPSKAWQTSVSQPVTQTHRNIAVYKYVMAIRPNFHLQEVLYLHPIVNFARDVEESVYDMATSRVGYYYKLAVTVCNFHKHEEKNEALRKKGLKIDEQRLDRVPRQRIKGIQWIVGHVQRTPPGATGQYLKLYEMGFMLKSTDEIPTELQDIVFADLIQSTKEWQNTLTEDRRDWWVYKLVQSVFPTPNQLEMKRLYFIVTYARTIEGIMYEKANSFFEYRALITQEQYKIRADLQMMAARRNQREFDRLLEVGGEGSQSQHQVIPGQEIDQMLQPRQP